MWIRSIVPPPDFSIPVCSTTGVFSREQDLSQRGRSPQGRGGRRPADRRRRLRPLRHSRGPDRRPARFGREEPDGDLQQRRRGRLRSGQAAANAPDQEDDLVLCGREQGVRAPVPGRRTRAGIHAPGHAGREAARRRCRHPGFLHQDRRRHHRGRGQGAARVQRRDLRDGTRAVPRGGAGQGRRGRPLGQPALQPDGAQLQPGRGHGRQGLHRRGRAHRRHRRDRPDDVHLPGIYVHRIVHNPTPEKRIEKRTTRDRK